MLAEPIERIPLSAAERRVLRLAGECLSDDAIALRLGVRAKTVRDHISAIRCKLGIPASERRTFWVYLGRLCERETSTDIVPIVNAVTLP